MKTVRNFAGAVLIGLVSLAGSAAPAQAAPCRDARGHFAKCSSSTASAASPVAQQHERGRQAQPQMMAHNGKTSPLRTAPISRRPAMPAAATAKKTAMHTKSAPKPHSKA